MPPRRAVWRPSNDDFSEDSDSLYGGGRTKPSRKPARKASAGKRKASAGKRKASAGKRKTSSGLKCRGKSPRKTNAVAGRMRSQGKRTMRSCSRKTKSGTKRVKKCSKGQKRYSVKSPKAHRARCGKNASRTVKARRSAAKKGRRNRSRSPARR